MVNIQRFNFLQRVIVWQGLIVICTAIDGSYKGYHIQNECCLLASSQLDAVLLLNHLQMSVRKTSAGNFYSNCSLCRKAFCVLLTICH